MEKISKRVANIECCQNNIQIRQAVPELHKVDEFWSLFSLANTIKSKTCFTKFDSSTVDLFLTNKPNFFQKINASKTGLSHHHKLMCNFFKSCYDRLKPKIVYYRNYKIFNDANFLNDVKIWDFSLKNDVPSKSDDFLTNTFVSICKLPCTSEKKVHRVKSSSLHD